LAAIDTAATKQELEDIYLPFIHVNIKIN